MLRAFGMFGLGILFITISPALRLSLMNDAANVHHAIEQNSPWSYVGIGVGILSLLVFMLHRAKQPRS